ncbi:ArsR/SmtB family transcription factor [Micrococcoides hystricis]|uniref:ArsR/SmtB family transcription factor n=1 Tax=Micrococcoides hystricis TaxID=1572761 RepID=A0ABV6PCC5_9MICC
MTVKAAVAVGELDEAATAVYAHLFQAMADPSRLAVLQHLAYGPHRVCDLVEHLDISQSTVSKHLKFLLECELVRLRPQGRSSWYSLAHPVLLADVINAAGALLQATGKDEQLCEHLRAPNAVQKE